MRECTTDRGGGTSVARAERHSAEKTLNKFNNDIFVIFVLKWLLFVSLFNPFFALYFFFDKMST